jgi:hypothetical protein
MARSNRGLASPSRAPLLLGALVTASGVALAACNVAVGGGVAALVGGSAVFASQCYDRVHITVRDATGSATCDAKVSVIDAEGDVRTLQPCYSAALTEGRWTIRAERAGYTPMTTSVVIAEHDDCPFYTHSVEMSLTRVGEAAVANQPADVARARAAAAADAAADEEEASPSGPPRRAFELLSAPAPAPASASPAPAPAASPTPSASPSPTPGAPAPAPAR